MMLFLASQENARRMDIEERRKEREADLEERRKDRPIYSNTHRINPADTCES